jgi:hypothetical protein
MARAFLFERFARGLSRQQARERAQRLIQSFARTRVYVNVFALP